MTYDFHNLSQFTLQQIATVFAKLPGKKYILVDDFVLPFLNRVAKLSQLQKMGVDKIFKMGELPPDASMERIVYLVPAHNDVIRRVISHIEIDKVKGIDRPKLVVFVPAYSEAAKHMLRSRGLDGGKVCITELCLGWLQLADDLITLDCPQVYADFAVNHCTTWSHFFGLRVAELVQLACTSPLAPRQCRVHCFGALAEIVGTGFRRGCLECPAPKVFARSGSSSSLASLRSSISSERQCDPPPLIVIFGRNVDYVTPHLIPLTFEALVNETMNVSLGMVDPPPGSNTKKFNWPSINPEYLLAVRDTPMKTILPVLLSFRSRIDDEQTSVNIHLSALRQQVQVSPLRGRQSQSTSADLAALGSQLQPLLSSRRDLTNLIACMEVIFNSMTKQECIEHLRAVQRDVLQSGSGQAVPSGESVSSNSSTKTGTLGDDLQSSVLRLFFEWLGSEHGENVNFALRLMCLLSATHDGLGVKLYRLMEAALVNCVGPSVLPMLVAMRHARLLYIRNEVTKTDPITECEATPTTLSALSKEEQRLKLLNQAAHSYSTWQGKRSSFNKVYSLFRLHCNAQVTADETLSPSFVFAGEFVPIVCRLTESIWAHSTMTGIQYPENYDQDPEILPLAKLQEGLHHLPVTKSKIRTLGAVSVNNEVEGRGMSSKLPPCSQKGQAVIVVMAGGCTFAEVAALRFVAKRRGWKLLIAASSMIHSRDLIQQSARAALHID